jgi:hypothetical protein
MDGFPLTRMCGRDWNRRSKRIRTSPLCGEYPSWVPYIFLEGGEGGDYIRDGIRD